MPGSRIAERLKPFPVAGNRVIVEVALHDRPQPLPRLRNRIVHALPQLLPDFLQFRAHPLAYRLPLHGEAPGCPGLPTHVGESQKIERLRLAFPLSASGTTPKSDSWPACLWVFWPWPSPTGLPPDCAADADQVSRFSCMMFPDVRGVFDCAGSYEDFVLAPPLVWSSPFVIGSTPWSFSFIAQYPACPCPCLRFALSLSADGARLGVMMGHYSCKTLSFSTSCRFIPAHNEPNLILCFQ